METIQQGTREWKLSRLGKVGASRMYDVITKGKTGYLAARANLMAELIAERLTGVPNEGYVNAAMQHGIDTESEARSAYEFHCDAQVVETGFVLHKTIADSGASPDGLVGEDGLVEIKCPNTATHIETLIGQNIASKYIVQMQWQMACTEREWCDFVSYDPRMPQHLRLYVTRVLRDQTAVNHMETELTKFLSELEEKLSQLSRLDR
jgi:putative phage-type endonuclease